MSAGTECPGCGSESSTIRRAFDDGEPCPACGLPASATAEILDARSRAADADLTKRYEDAVKRIGKLEAENRALRDALGGFRIAMANSDIAIKKAGASSVSQRGDPGLQAGGVEAVSGWTVTYVKHGNRRSREFPTVEIAVCFAGDGIENGTYDPIRIEGPAGQVLEGDDLVDVIARFQIPERYGAVSEHPAVRHGEHG